MKKQFIISLILFVCIEFVSCASGHRPGDILYPAPISGRSSTGRISLEEFNEKEIVFKIRISLDEAMWLEHLILDEEENVISEESFYHDVMRREYTRKLKAKAEFKFTKGKEYTLYIGYKLASPHPVHGLFQLFYSYKFVL